MSDFNLEQLNTEFGIAESVQFVSGKGKLPVVRVSTPLCTGEVALHGAHVLSFIPAGAGETIFVAEEAIFEEGTAVRGGIPVCWPWFGDHLRDSDVYSHGFARRMFWDVSGISMGADGTVELVFVCSGKGAVGWPIEYRGVLKVLLGRTLEVSLTTENISEQTVEVTNALHTYFNVSDVEQIRVEGLDGCTYVDDVDGAKLKQQSGDVLIAEEVDRIYQDTEGACTIVDKGLGRRLQVSKRGSLSTVVWNPHAKLAAGMKDMGNEEYRNMLCIEAVNVFKDKLSLAPGQSHTIAQILEVLPL